MPYRTIVIIATATVLGMASAPVTRRLFAAEALVAALPIAVP
jgi:hypothetical protein